MWIDNTRALATMQFFVEWVNVVFDPAVKKYLQENKLPQQALLILNDAPATHLMLKMTFSMSLCSLMFFAYHLIQPE